MGGGNVDLQDHYNRLPIGLGGGRVATQKQDPGLVVVAGD